MRITSKLCAAIMGIQVNSHKKFSIRLGTRVGFPLVAKSNRTTELSGLAKPALNDDLLS